MTDATEDPLDASRGHLARGDFKAAARALRTAFAADTLDSERLGEAMEVLRAVARGLHLVDLSRALSGVLRTAPTFLQRLLGRSGEPTAAAWLAAGWACVDVGLPEAAVHILRRGLTLSPGQLDLVAGLMATLGHANRHADAVEVAAQAPDGTRSSPLVRSLRCRHLLLSGRLDAARAQAETLDRDDPDLRPLHDELRRMLARAALVEGTTALDNRDLRGWQFVLTGTLITHLSPYGRDDGMAGRWAFVQDQGSEVHLGLSRLASVLAALGVPPARVLHASDRGSVLVASACARLLDLPLAELDGGPGLVVVDDLAALSDEALSHLRAHRPDRLLYAHAQCWTQEGQVAPDVVTVLYQHRTAPWEAQIRIDPETRTVKTTDPDPRPTAEIVDGILSSALEADPDDGVDAVVKIATAARAAFVHRSGARDRFLGGSGPVPSSRFL